MQNKINIPLICVVAGTVLSLTVLIVSIFKENLPSEVILATSSGATTLFGTAGGIATPRRAEETEKDSNS